MFHLFHFAVGKYTIFPSSLNFVGMKLNVTDWNIIPYADAWTDKGWFDASYSVPSRQGRV